MAGWREPEKEWLPMKKKRGGADNGDVGFDDLPGAVGGDDDLLNETGEQLQENTGKRMNDAEDGNYRPITGTGLAIETGGEVSTSENTTAVRLSDVAISVRETGEKLIQVPGNADKVVEKIFDIESKDDG